MALRPTAKDLKTKRLAEAGAATLREQGRAEEADAIDYLLSPSGWPMLGRLRAAEGGSTELDRNLAVQVASAFVEHVKRAAENDPADDVWNVTDAVNKGLRLFVAGEFTPSAPKRAERGTAGPKVNLNVRPDGQLRAQAQARLEDPEFAAGLGSTMKLGALVRDYLMRTYPMPGGKVPEAASKPGLARGSDRILRVPLPVREMVRSKAREFQVAVEDVVDEGMQKVLDGMFEPVAPEWTEREKAALVPLKIRPNDDLWLRVKDAQALSPHQVAIDYLMDQFGI